MKIRSLIKRFALVAGLVLASANLWAAPSLIATNITTDVVPVVSTNVDGSITVIGGGNDTWDTADSFTFLFETRSGDFDVNVRVLELDTTRDSAKASLMVRANLTPGSPTVMINALPQVPNDKIETIYRPSQNAGMDDMPDRPTSNTTPTGKSTYPDVWLRIKRDGNSFTTLYGNSTNQWTILSQVYVSAEDFPSSLYVGLSTVRHISPEDEVADPDLKNARVKATYAEYGNTPVPPPATIDGSPADTNAPGIYPSSSVTAVNWKIEVPSDGLGPNGSPLIYNADNKNEIILTIDGEGPIAWSAPGYNQGDVDFLIGVANKTNAQQNLGAYSNPKRDHDQNGDNPTRAALPQSQGWAPTLSEGVILGSVRKNSQQWNDGSPAFHAFSWTSTHDGSSRAGYSTLDGRFGGSQIYFCLGKLGETATLPSASSPNALREANIDSAVAWFPFAQGWKAGHIRGHDSGQPTASWEAQGSHSTTVADGTISKYSAVELLSWSDNDAGLATLTLPGVKTTNGMLFATSTHEGNDNRGKIVTTPPLADGSGWTVAIRQDDEVRDPEVYATPDQAGFAFVFIPYDAVNLIGGEIAGATGSTVKSGGSFTLSRLEAGRYSLTIPGKTGTNGMLLLQNAGMLASQPSVADTSVLSYEYQDGSFIIESRYASGDGSADDTFPLRDANFYFTWIDFTSPLTPPEPAPAPSLSIAIAGSGSVTISWPVAVTGYSLESSDKVVGGIWTDVSGVANNSVTVTPSATSRFFRLHK